MSEDTSLTDAVKRTAGISLTKAVKDVAGCRCSFVDEVLDTQSQATLAARWARWLLGACSRFAAYAFLSLTFLQATSIALDADRPSTAGHGRVALVIGNSAYHHTSQVENPKNDAADIGAELKKLGFYVIEGFDLDKGAFDRKVREFAAALQGAKVGLFFYAGHGMQVAGQNYLVPVDANPTSTSALDFAMVRLDLVQHTMEREAQTNLLFFDACRDNPLSHNLAKVMGARSAEIGRGLAAVESGAGTLISFSTQPGNVALDGVGRNSPFSGALVRQMRTSNEDLNAILMAVRNDVIGETDGKQVPWEHTALTRRFYFNPDSAVQTSAIAPATQHRLSEAAEAWSATKDTASLALLDAFVLRFRDTFFAELARARIEELRKR